LRYCFRLTAALALCDGAGTMALGMLAAGLESGGGSFVCNRGVHPDAIMRSE
jgi:hypothetical protein